MDLCDACGFRKWNLLFAFILRFVQVLCHMLLPTMKGHDIGRYGNGFVNTAEEAVFRCRWSLELGDVTLLFLLCVLLMKLLTEWDRELNIKAEILRILRFVFSEWLCSLHGSTSYWDCLGIWSFVLCILIFLWGIAGKWYSALQIYVWYWACVFCYVK